MGSFLYWNSSSETKNRLKILLNYTDRDNFICCNIYLQKMQVVSQADFFLLNRGPVIYGNMAFLSYLSPEGRHPREEEVRHDAHRPHVGPEPGALAVHHLGGDELGLPVVQLHVACDYGKSQYFNATKSVIIIKLYV